MMMRKKVSISSKTRVDSWKKCNRGRQRVIKNVKVWKKKRIGRGETAGACDLNFDVVPGLAWVTTCLHVLVWIS